MIMTVAMTRIKHPTPRIISGKKKITIIAIIMSVNGSTVFLLVFKNTDVSILIERQHFVISSKSFSCFAQQSSKLYVAQKSLSARVSAERLILCINFPVSLQRINDSLCNFTYILIICIDPVVICCVQVLSFIKQFFYSLH